MVGLYRPAREFVNHMETSPLPVKGCKFWLILDTSEGSLACHTYCDTRHPFIMAIAEDPWHSNLKPSLSVFTTFVCSGLDSNIQPSACGANALIHCATAAVHTKLKSISILHACLNLSLDTFTIDFIMFKAISTVWSKQIVHVAKWFLYTRYKKIKRYNWKIFAQVYFVPLKGKVVLIYKK